MDPEYHNHLSLKLELNLPTPIEIKFRSVSRNFSSAELIHEPSQTWEERGWVYACLSGHTTVSNWVASIYPISHYEKNQVRKAVLKAFQKCESLYGSSVQDYDQFDADCTLTII